MKKYPTLYYEKSIYDEENDTIYVVAGILAGRSISQRQVGYLQDKLEEELAKKTELSIRSSLVNTVNALDSRIQIEDVDLDGDFVSDNPDKLVLQTKQADTVIRNYLDDVPGALLKFVHVFKDGNRNRLYVVAAIDSLFMPETEEIRKVEWGAAGGVGRAEPRLVHSMPEVGCFYQERSLSSRHNGFYRR